jgi:hypothetical protein
MCNVFLPEEVVYHILSYNTLPYTKGTCKTMTRIEDDLRDERSMRIVERWEMDTEDHLLMSSWIDKDILTSKSHTRRTMSYSLSKRAIEKGDEDLLRRALDLAKAYGSDYTNLIAACIDGNLPAQMKIVMDVCNHGCVYMGDILNRCMRSPNWMSVIDVVLERMSDEHIEREMVPSLPRMDKPFVHILSRREKVAETILIISILRGYTQLSLCIVMIRSIGPINPDVLEKGADYIGLISKRSSVLDRMDRYLCGLFQL